MVEMTCDMLHQLNKEARQILILTLRPEAPAHTGQRNQIQRNECGVLFGGKNVAFDTVIDLSATFFLKESCLHFFGFCQFLGWKMIHSAHAPR